MKALLVQFEVVRLLDYWHLFHQSGRQHLDYLRSLDRVQIKPSQVFVVTVSLSEIVHAWGNLQILRVILVNLIFIRLLILCGDQENFALGD